ncbi:MAG: hypothetical protein ABR964_16445 [Tepidisphaeraceae bacterium]
MKNRLLSVLQRVAAFGICVLALASCSSSDNGLGSWSGPQMLASVSVEPAASAGPEVTLIRTQHYRIYSTIQDHPELLQRVGQLMEGAFSLYRTMAPGVPATDHPMQGYLFADRVQWEQFTRGHAGPDANIYLKISRGGYTIRDWYVAYYIGDIGTCSVAAHEGWHQYVNRHFKGRLPPFLEEGIATMFEDIEWSDSLPRWNLSVNPTRALSLRKVMDARETFPLEKLMTLHAGDVVNLSGIRIEAFYAQDWAFARYLWEGENGKYRPALQQLLTDTASGTVFDPTGSLRRSYLPWNPRGVGPMLEHYLHQDLAVTAAGFQQFMSKIAYEELSQQFNL